MSIPKPSDALFPDAPDSFLILDETISSNSIATLAEVQKIHTALGENAPKISLALAFACADQGASAYVIPVGKHGTMELSRAADIVRKVCTLRQFCMYYSKVVYDSMKSRDRAPANWVRKGFSYETRFAAFDFFSGTYSAAAPDPPYTLRYRPTPEEIAMHNKNAYALIEMSRRAGNSSTLGVITAAQQTQQPSRHLSLGNLN
ncbi:coat protein [Donkey orchid symptomless virus]|uniref:Coat protein n=1 Tax=Donkey orchid symptomless virus TaxID=1400526 RepID=V5LUE3_9VIRU|nr:coat protein [Donkey orchid symptomless virus]AHA56696.1 coat protein [Donkey orchid symptomless virus]